MPDRLTALDATFLELEEADDSAHMHIGGALVFQAPPGGAPPTLAEVQAGLAERLDRLPRYRQRLSSPRTGGFAWPVWEEDDRFDVAGHVRESELPPPGGDAELLDWIGDFYSHRLDRSRPLWEMVLVLGLSGDRWALCWKTHHCLVDGVGSVDVSHVLLDAEPDPAQPAADDVPFGREGHGELRWPVHPPETLRQAAGAGLAGARAAVDAALHPREVVRRTAALAGLIVRNEVIGAPDCSLNAPIGGTRHMAVIRASLDELKQVKRTRGGTVNDVVLTVVAAGLRRLLSERGEHLPRTLRAMVPVNIRAPGEGGALGNRIVSLFAELPIAESDPARRYERVVEEMRRLKSGPQGTGAGALLGLSALAPPVVHATLARSLFATRLFNVTITNVPGPAQRLYAFGSPLLEVIPLVPLAAEHAVGFAIFSYAGQVTFGLNADYDSVPDLDVLATGIAAAIDELVEISSSPSDHLVA